MYTKINMNEHSFALLLAMILFCWTASLPAAGTDPVPVDLISDLILGDIAVSAAAGEKLKDYSLEDLVECIQTFIAYPLPDTSGSLVKSEHAINDTLNAPYLYYIPSGYNPATSTPLVVWLHGGVGRTDFFTESAVEYFSDHPIVEKCEEEGWLALLPLGRSGLTWWDKSGMDHINWLVRETKRNINIDDDRIVMCGFSDGASGAFHFALLSPTDYSLFFPWSGFISVGSLVGGMQVYLPNLRARLLFPVNGGADGLYPTERMKPLMELSIVAGAGLTYTSYDTATHNAGYLAMELPFFTDAVKEMPRSPFKTEIYWECDNLEFGSADWLQITTLDTGVAKADWHHDYPYTLINDRITIGFMVDTKWEGEGVRVESLSDDTSSAAVKMGLAAGDIVISLDDIPTLDAQQLSKAKGTKKRGDDVTLKVIRNQETIQLKAVFPPPAEYAAFPRGAPSGAIEASRKGNRFDVLASRIKEFSIFLHPEMVALDRQVQVYVNGSLVFGKKVTADTGLMLKEFTKNRDRTLLWSARIDDALK